MKFVNLGTFNCGWFISGFLSITVWDSAVFDSGISSKFCISFLIAELVQNPESFVCDKQTKKKSSAASKTEDDNFPQMKHGR